MAGKDSDGRQYLSRLRVGWRGGELAAGDVAWLGVPHTNAWGVSLPAVDSVLQLPGFASGSLLSLGNQLGGGAIVVGVVAMVWPGERGRGVWWGCGDGGVAQVAGPAACLMGEG